MLVRLACAAMGTRFELLLTGADPVFLRSAGEEALAEIENWDRQLSRFQAGSLTSLWSMGAESDGFLLDADCLELWRTCFAVHAQSEGAFDPSLGRRMASLGFWGAAEQARADAEPQSADVGASGMQRLRLEGERLFNLAKRGESPLQLDFGAIGKGFALDCAARSLIESGVRHALLHGGTSTVIALGNPAGVSERESQSGWKVQIATGRVEDPPVVCELIGAGQAGQDSFAPQCCALSVSAPHGRVVQATAGDLQQTESAAVETHVLDPRTGQGSRAARCAAVVGPSASLCDAWSTALLVRPSLLAEGARRAPEELTALIVPADSKPTGAEEGGLEGLVTEVLGPRADKALRPAQNLRAHLSGAQPDLFSFPATLSGADDRLIPD